MQSTKDLRRQARNTYLYYSILFFLFCTCYSCLTYNTAYYLDYLEEKFTKLYQI